MTMNRYDFTGVAEWHQIQGWFELPQAIAMQTFVKQLPPGWKLVELGSFQGRSSVAIASVMPPDSFFYCVDHFQGSQEHKRANLEISNLLEAFTQTIERLGIKDKIYTGAMSTEEAAAEGEVVINSLWMHKKPFRGV